MHVSGKQSFLTPILTLLVLGFLVSCGGAGAGGGPDDGGDGDGTQPQPEVTADAGGPYAALWENPVVEFDASDSSDPGGRVDAYLWDPGDGSPLVVNDTPTQSHSYPNTAAAYTVTLVLLDSGGSPLDWDTSVTRIRARPNAAFTPPASATLGDPALFDASASDDGDGLGEVAYYEWDFDYDGSFHMDQRTSAPLTTHSFAAKGEHTVGLIVIDDDGFSSSAVSATVSVADAQGAVITIE